VNSSMAALARRELGGLHGALVHTVGKSNAEQTLLNPVTL
jgi:hypothetical protein